MDSPVWDIEDCAPVWTGEQIMANRPDSSLKAELAARWERYRCTAESIDWMIDGFVIDFAKLVRDAIAEEEKSYGRG